MVSMAVRSTRRYMAAFLAGGRKAAAIRRSGVVEGGKGTRAPGAGCGALCGCVCAAAVREREEKQRSRLGSGSLLCEWRR